MAMPVDLPRGSPLTRTAVFLSLTAALENSGIPSCVMGDTRAFPDEIGSDVDIVVPQTALSALPDLLFRFCREHHLRLVQVFQHELTAWYYTLAWEGENTQLLFLNPDICGDFYRVGKQYLKADELLSNRMPDVSEYGQPKGFHIAAPAINFAYYLIKKIDKHDLSVESGAYLSAQWRQDRGGAGAQVRRFWRDADAELLIQTADTNQWTTVIDLLPRLRRSLRRGRPFSLSASLCELGRKMRRAVQPTGFMIAVLGPDGSGKSSMIERTLARLAPAFRRTTSRHLRPHFGRPGPPGPPIENPHAKPPRGRVLSLVKLFYLWLDYTLGYACSVYPQLARSTLVVFDRYYHDLLVDPRRYRFQRAGRMARWIGRLMPQPDLWIVLDAPAEVLHERKQEVSLDESARQSEAYRKLGTTMKRAVILDAAQPMEQVASHAGNAVLAALELRTLRRFRQKRE